MATTVEAAVGSILAESPDMGAKKIVAMVKETHPALVEQTNAKSVSLKIAAQMANRSTVSQPPGGREPLIDRSAMSAPGAGSNAELS